MQKPNAPTRTLIFAAKFGWAKGAAEVTTATHLDSPTVEWAGDALRIGLEAITTYFTTNPQSPGRLTGSEILRETMNTARALSILAHVHYPQDQEEQP